MEKKLNRYSLKSPEVVAAQAQDRLDAQDYAKTWQDLTAQRLNAAAQGQSSPWLGVKQWLTEIPLNANIKGYDEDAAANIDKREQAFQAEKQRLLDLANQGKEAVPRTVWAGVR